MLPNKQLTVPMPGMEPESVDIVCESEPVGAARQHGGKPFAWVQLSGKAAAAVHA